MLSLYAALLLSATNLYAADAAPAGGNPLASFFPLIVIFVIFYFLLIRPQQKKAKEHQKLLSALKKDDKVIYAKYGGTEVTVEGKDYVILDQDSIYAIKE
jgi:preprotein translocase subunit YajC